MVENIVEILLDRYRETQEYTKNSIDIFRQGFKCALKLAAECELL